MKIVYIHPETTPEIYRRMETPFVKDLIKGHGVPVNGEFMPHALWNLICSHRDLHLWTKYKMKPHRHWKVSDVKKYFGIKGSGETLLERFEKLKKEVDDLYNLNNNNG
jgi:hypothetical protein